MRQQIKGFLLQEGSFKVEDSESLKYDSSLIDFGVLQSYNVIKLIVFLEERFGVKFESSDLAERNFRTIDAIADLVARKKGEGGGLDGRS